MKRKLKAGTTSHIEQIVIDDITSTTGAGLTGLVYNSSGLTAKYKRTGDSAWTTITLASTTVGTWASGGFVESAAAGGEYEFHVPNAVLASGVDGAVVVIYGATNMAPVRIEYELDVVDYQTTAFGANTVAPDNASIAAIANDTGTAIPSQIAALNDVAITDILSDGVPLNTTSGVLDRVTLVDTTITNTDMRGTDGANTTVPDNVSIAAILEDTGTTLPAQISSVSGLDAAGVRAAIGMAAANLDTQLDGIASQTDKMTFTGTAINATISDATTPGTGKVLITKDYGGTDNLTYVLNGVPVVDATIEIFLYSDYVAGNRDAKYRIASTRQSVDGTWVTKIYLDPQTYVLRYYCTGVAGPDEFKLVVSDNESEISFTPL